LESQKDGNTHKTTFVKKFGTILFVGLVARALLAQGTVNTANTAGTLFLTNAIPNGGTSGNTASGALSPRGFLFEVLTAPSTVTSVDPSLQALLSGPWSDTGLTMTNSLLASGGRISGPSGTSGQAANWAPGVFQSFIVVGWSANEGANWAALSANLFGAHFNGTLWDNNGSFGQLVNGGFLGASTVQQGAAGDAVGAAPFSLFGSAGSAQGTPITTPTYLYTFGPEPSSAAVATFGLIMFAIVRKHKGSNKRD
jgi:hypothetical protein